MLTGQLRRSMTDENGPDVHRSLHGGRKHYQMVGHNDNMDQDG